MGLLYLTAVVQKKDDCSSGDHRWGGAGGCDWREWELQEDRALPWGSVSSQRQGSGGGSEHRTRLTYVANGSVSVHGRSRPSVLGIRESGYVHSPGWAAASWSGVQEGQSAG